ncbi:MAG TPA: DNA (cytosine-5-)-methyltransferase [Baekduia sp.]|uniref:DNA cytosine methyltransferase n=1 Tax=Baekduia sp. TaxID=2600305 RepID=UPI002D7A3F96|nr:DNA (cytosine-5-)-methyltransferase [Baekduia sp.]HET6507112.1 DNA (cytosine-5-)-methyltransferase [Baekduia sp.]
MDAAQTALPIPAEPRRLRLRTAGLFAGIGGIELGLSRVGHATVLLCENFEPAQRVLAERFPESPLVDDVRDIERLPEVDLVAAGFPCQDLSQAGRTAGITGERSGLVGEVFRLLDSAPKDPDWLLLENVPFMLQLERGEAMRFLTSELSRRGFSWAYRIVDTRAFGLPQRRQRVLVLASRTKDPRPVLLTEDHGVVNTEGTPGEVACGFYWTEGVRGLGWAIDAIPTLKGGSTVGIPSPPAIWMPDGRIVLPDIRDAERLQGFPSGWTASSVDDPSRRNGPRWKLVGNAVSVPVAEWLGRRLVAPTTVYDETADAPLEGGHRWPSAAWGGPDTRVHGSPVSTWPRHVPATSLADFLEYPTTPLSERATAGFLRRTQQGRLRFAEGFIAALRRHHESLTAQLETV